MAASLARPAPDIRRPWRWRLHRWRWRIVRRERVWDDAAVWRVLARCGPYAVARRDESDLFYTDGAGESEPRVLVWTFDERCEALDRLMAAF